MKRFFKYFFYTILALVLIAIAAFITFFAPIMSGMAAKTMCSCVYVTGRTPESVLQKEFDVFPGLSTANIEFGEDSTVSASILFRSSKAIYRKGLGCTLLQEADEETVRNQNVRLPPPPPFDADTVAWPLGNVVDAKVDSGVNQQLLKETVDNAFRDKFPERPIYTHAVVVVYKGNIIAEQYADGFDKRSRLMGWSMTKSITSALIGILQGKGKIAMDEFAPVAEWQSDERKNIRMDDLMHATSGLEWDEGYFDPFGDFHQMFIFSDDKARYAASKPLKHPIGEYFQYSSGTTNIISRILREKVGDREYYQFPYTELFYKTGMLGAIIEPDASGTFVASSYSYATARDWARLGMLYLNDGIVNGERILPEGWVDYSLTSSDAAPKQQYGAQIWLNYGAKDNPADVEYEGLPNEAFLFDGFERNFVVMVPSKDLVVVRLGVTHNTDFSLADLVNGVIAALPKE